MTLIMETRAASIIKDPNDPNFAPGITYYWRIDEINDK